MFHVFPQRADRVTPLASVENRRFDTDRCPSYTSPFNLPETPVEVGPLINATRILVLFGAVVFALSGGDVLAQAKDSPPAVKDAAPAPVKDATAPVKDAATPPAKDAVTPPAKDGVAAPVKDAGPDAKGKTDTKSPVVTAPVPVPSPPVVPPKPAPYVVVPGTGTANSVLGSLDPEKDKVQVTLTPLGAAIVDVLSSQYHKTVEGDEPYRLAGELTYREDGKDKTFERPMSAWKVSINGTDVSLFKAIWTLESPGVFSIQIADRAAKPVLKITRTYTLDGYELTCNTVFENLGGAGAAPLKLIWSQNAIGDVRKESDYRGDAREVTVGYHDTEYDDRRVHVYTDEGQFTRQSMLDEYEERLKEVGQIQQGIAALRSQGNNVEADALRDNLTRLLTTPPFWPHEDAPASEAVWVASINRYFTSIVYRPVPLLTEETEEKSKALPLVELFEPAIGISKRGVRVDRLDHRQMMFTLTSHPFTVEAGKKHAITLAVFNGPRQSTLLNSKPIYRILELEEHLVRYELGCTICLFQGLADFLLGFLRLLEMVVSDWGIAIIILVLCVRLLLHPLTKKSQISMTVMGKQMAAIQPEMKKIKEKFKNDSQRQQQEMMKLYREKGINPLGFLGCLPMFLQMPIWIALYAMLWGAIELRHEPAFFGLFQSINSDWAFLRDLSTYDNFITFEGKGFDMPLCGIHIPAALNILPLLMAVMFYFQQKLSSPEPTTDQQKQQQKMMKFMVFLFPIMLYPAPSGLTLYILASSTAGMIDSYLVRKHIKQMEADGTLFQKKERKPGGFMDRLSTAVESKQKQMQARDQALKGGKGSGGGGGRRGGKSKKR